jgi:hypothetical protein
MSIDVSLSNKVQIFISETKGALPIASGLKRYIYSTKSYSSGFK